MYILVESSILRNAYTFIQKEWALVYAKKRKPVLFISHSVATVLQWLVSVTLQATWYLDMYLN